MLFLRVADLVDEEGAEGVVLFLPKKEAIGGKTVAAGASGFLIELLDAIRQTKADDGTDVGFIDAEAEGDGANEHVHLFTHPLFLRGAACGGVHLAVIANGGDAAFFQ